MRGLREALIAPGGAVEIVDGLTHRPNDLITSRPGIRSLADFKPGDKIALPAVGVSVRSRILQMAAEQFFDEGQFARLDANTVSLPTPTPPPRCSPAPPRSPRISRTRRSRNER